MPTKILAIDDSKTMRLAIKITFAAEDADVTSVGKGGEAVARAKQMGADVILLDASLADGEPTGLELCRQLKDDRDTAEIPIILMVSNQNPPPTDAVEAAGADETVVKPFDTQDLIDKVATVQGKPVQKATPSVMKPAVAAKPAIAARSPIAATPAATTPKAPAKPAPSRVPASPPPAAAKSARVSAITEVGMPTPIDPGAAPAAPAMAAPAAPTTGAAIPIAIPIPFTAASAPTAGMSARLAEVAGNAGIDPKIAEAIASLSREVVERVVWEVVPELAESLIKEKAAG